MSQSEPTGEKEKQCEHDWEKVGRVYRCRKCGEPGYELKEK